MWRGCGGAYHTTLAGSGQSNGTKFEPYWKTLQGMRPCYTTVTQKGKAKQPISVAFKVTGKKKEGSTIWPSFPPRMID